MCIWKKICRNIWANSLMMWWKDEMLSLFSLRPVLNWVCPQKNGGGRFHLTLAAISLTLSLHLGILPFLKPTFRISSSTCLFHVFFGRPRKENWNLLVALSSLVVAEHRGDKTLLMRRQKCICLRTNYYHFHPNTTHFGKGKYKVYSKIAEHITCCRRYTAVTNHTAEHERSGALILIAPYSIFNLNVLTLAVRIFWHKRESWISI